MVIVERLHQLLTLLLWQVVSFRKIPLQILHVSWVLDLVGSDRVVLLLVRVLSWLYLLFGKARLAFRSRDHQALQLLRVV